MYSPSGSSAAETSLPTPDQAYSSRRTSLTSPRVIVDGMSPETLTSPIQPLEEEGSKAMPDYLETSTASSFASIPPPSAAPRRYGMVTPNAKERQQNTLPSSSSMSSSRERSNTASSIRAPPPPPILLRRPTDLQGGHVEDIPLGTGSSSSSFRSASRSPQPGMKRIVSQTGPEGGKGLNIAGMPSANDTTSPSLDAEEEGDALHALKEITGAPSPRRAFFANADMNGAPKSPAWQSFEVSPKPSSPGSPSRLLFRRGSVEVPFSPLGPNANTSASMTNGGAGERKFDPTPQHGIHSRNLSLFFPSPGNSHTQGKLSVPATPNFATLSPPEHSPAVLHAGSSGHRRAFVGTGDWKFGSQSNGENGTATPETVKSKRRGHHHKHSLSHNFFSFLDPTQTNPALARTPSPANSPNVAVDTPHPVPMPLLSTPSVLPGSPTIIPLPPSSKHNPRKQLLVSFAVMELLIGAGLWIEGQMSGWRCLAGVGYLVVFDAIGVSVGMFEQSGEGWRSIRRPYGVTRLTALLHFTQSLFLVFAAVYIAKESIEQVVLGSGAHEHGGHTHGHSHGQLAVEDEERPLPNFLLLSATMCSIFSGTYLRNHQRLVDAVGPLFLPYRWMRSHLVQRGVVFLGNPFSVTIAGMCGAILLSSITVPPSSLHVVDACLSLLLTVLAVALSYPPTLAFGHVLLQTAPPVTSNQMQSLRRAVRDIEDDRRVLGVAKLRCWTIGAGHAAPLKKDDTLWSFTPSHSRNPSASTPSSPLSPITGSMTKSPGLNDSPESPTRSKGGKGSSATLSAPAPSNGPTAGLGLGSIGPISNSLSPSSSSMGMGTGSTDEPYVPVIVSLTVHVHPDVSDRDMIDITKLAYTKLDNAVGTRGRVQLAGGREKGGRGGGGGLSGGRVGGSGEITVSIKRGWEDE